MEAKKKGAVWYWHPPKPEGGDDPSGGGDKCVSRQGSRSELGPLDPLGTLHSSQGGNGYHGGSARKETKLGPLDPLGAQTPSYSSSTLSESAYLRGEDQEDQEDQGPLDGRRPNAAMATIAIPPEETGE